MINILIAAGHAIGVDVLSQHALRGRKSLQNELTGSPGFLSLSAPISGLCMRSTDICEQLWDNLLNN